MKKVYTLKKCALLTLLICISSIAFAQDFNIQHIQDDIGRTGGTNTSFTAVSSLNNAFALPTNNRKTHAGRADGSTAALEGDDMAGARVLTGTGTLTYYREGASRADNMRFNTDIWEYTGTPGGANEFIVRGRYVANLNSGGTGSGFTFVDIDVSAAGIVTPNKVIPIITGIMNDDTTNGGDSATGIAHLTSSTNLIVRKGTTSNNVQIYITLVEFTGSNWTVLHGNTTSTANTGSITLYDGYDATGTATNVSDWSNSLILTQSKAQTATSGGELEKIRSQWPIMAPGADNQTVDWSWHATRVTTGNSNRHFIHVLNNPDLTVTRFTNTSFTAGETPIDITSAGLTDLAQSSIIGSFYTAGNGSGYAQGYRNYYLNSLTQAAHWCAKDGNVGGVMHNIQIIDLYTVPPTTTQGPGGFAAEIQLWLKANEGVEEATSDPAEDTDIVLNWLDNSINSNDAIQSTSGNRPIYNKSGLNFNPMINFDGTNHEMTANTMPNSIITIFAVGEGTYVSDSKNIVNINNAGSGSVVIEKTASTTLRGRYFDGTAPSGIVSATVANATPFLMDYEHSAGGTSELFDAGISQGTASANADNLSGTLTTYIGGHPSNTLRRWDGGVAEIVIYNQAISISERDKIESYFAIKYGFTLGVNGTSQDYVDSDGTVIWDQSDNSGYNYNVAGVGIDNASGLEQKQSKTVNTNDDITVGIKTIANANEDNTTSFFADKTFLVWGNDNGATTATTDITKDFSSGITGITSSVSATPIERKWKMVVKDSVPTVKLSIPKTMVSSTHVSGEDYIMIVADDDTFTTNVTSTTMNDTGSTLETEFYFEGTKYITFGSAAETAEMSRAVSFDRSDMYLSAGDVNDLANTDYTISAWVKRNAGQGKFDVVSKRNYYNENTDLEPGPDEDGTYTHGYAFRINKTNQFRMVWRDPSDPTNNILETSATIPEDEWHHICATYDSSEGPLGTTTLYIDGILEDRDDTLDPMNIDSDAHFMIGAAHHIKRQQRHSGSVDEVRVWNVALTPEQIQYVMNQEIEENATLADGKIIPTNTTKNEIISIPWNNLIAYYPMSRMVFGSMQDYSNSGNDASMINYDHVDEQTAPLPYVSTQNGDWDTDTTWVNGDVQYIPGVDTYLDIVQTIDWNIVQIDHNVTMENKDTSLIPAANGDNRTLLGLVVGGSGDLEVVGETSSVDGNSLTVSHYLKIDGTIDLDGESQLIQTTDSDLDVTSSGILERDQQGTADLYTYNYWSSPVGATNITSNNNSYTMPDILMDGTDTATPVAITFLTSGYDGANGIPISIADYWIWKFANQLDDDYSAWQHVRSTGSILAGEGYTMKGVTDTGGSLSLEQNYSYQGKPNNGDISLTINNGNDYLVGNPYPSAIDANQFIADNTETTGALYYWEHWGGGSHYLAEYEGGYAIYNLSGGTPAAAPDPDVAQTGVGTKTPGRYIPVGQGFFVIGDADGTIDFNNNQRLFYKEGANSVSLSPNSNNQNTNRSTSNEDVDLRKKIRIGFSSPNSFNRQLLVTEDVNSTSGIDFAYDASLYELFNDDMFWRIEDENYLIQGVPQFEDLTILPLGFRTEVEGLSTVKIDELINMESTSLIVYVHDKDLGLYHNLQDSDYEFYSVAGENLNRLEIVFSTEVLNIEDNEINGLDIHYSNEINSIVLINPMYKEIKSIELFNTLGQIVYSVKANTNSDYAEYKVSNFSTGTYIINLNTPYGTLSKKILIE